MWWLHGLCMFVKTHYAVHLKSVHFTDCKYKKNVKKKTFWVNLMTYILLMRQLGLKKWSDDLLMFIVGVEKPVLFNENCTFYLLKSGKIFTRQFIMIWKKCLCTYIRRKKTKNMKMFPTFYSVYVHSYILWR